MLLHSLLSFFSVTFLWLCWQYKTKFQSSKIALLLVLILISIFSALRYDYGNDYLGYYDEFLNYKYTKTVVNIYLEEGWLWLYKIFAPLNFFWLVGFLAVFQTSILYYILRKYCPYKLYWQAIFCFMIIPSNMLIGLSAMRQSVAISFYLLFIDALLSKKFFYCIIYSILGFYFHKSILLAIFVTLFVYLFNWIKYNYFFIISVLAMILFYYMGEDIFNYGLRYLVNITDKYDVYKDKALVGSGLGFLVYIYFLFFYSFSLGNTSDFSKSLIVKLASLVYIMTPLSFVEQNFVRVAYYFDSLTMLAVPIIYMKLQNKKLKAIFIITFLGWNFFIYLSFFNSPVWKEHYYLYKSIFSIN